MKKAQKSYFVVLAELSAGIHPILATVGPYCVRRTHFRGRVVLEVSFQAEACGFTPGGGVDVKVGSRFPVFMESFGVLCIGEYLPGKDEPLFIENRTLCPVCSRLSLRMGVREKLEGKAPKLRYQCQRKGCDGSRDL